MSLAPLILAESPVCSTIDKGVNQQKHIALNGRYILVDKDGPQISEHLSPTRIKPLPLIDNQLSTPCRAQPTPQTTLAKNGGCKRKPCTPVNDVQMLRL